MRRVLTMLAATPAVHVVAAVAVAALAVQVPGPERALVLAPILLFLPGYALLHALGLRADPVLRLGLSAGLSIAIVPLVGLGVWVVRGTLDPELAGAALAAFALVCALASLRHRWRRGPGGWYGGAVRIAVVALLAVVIVGVLLEVLPGTPRTPFTQVALAGQWAAVDDAVVVPADTRVDVEVQVTNRTGRTATFVLEPAMRGASWQGASVELADGETWRGTVTGAVPAGGCLHRLRVGVREEGAATALEGVTVWFATRDPLPEGCARSGR